MGIVRTEFCAIDVQRDRGDKKDVQYEYERVVRGREGGCVLWC